MITKEVNNLDELLKAIEEIGDRQGIIQVVSSITLEPGQTIRLPVNVTFVGAGYRMGMV